MKTTKRNKKEEELFLGLQSIKFNDDVAGSCRTPLAGKTVQIDGSEINN
jgi:hypothetical protein